MLFIAILFASIIKRALMEFHKELNMIEIVVVLNEICTSYITILLCYYGIAHYKNILHIFDSSLYADENCHLFGFDK
jgi:hypothetical protein